MTRFDPDVLLERTLELAERGRYTVSPNPMVGAIVARRGRVVAEGWHRRAGGPHAEVEALDRAGRSARGADMFVSLEPCVHVGRTPPCVPRIVESGIARVFVAARDPNPLVSGQKDIPIVRSGGAGYNQTNGPLPGPTVAGAAGVTEQPSHRGVRATNLRPSRRRGSSGRG